MPAGPAPKLQRSRRQTPAGGDWQVLEPLDAPILPTLEEMDPTTEWTYRSNRMWEAWRRDPVTATWEDADVNFALETIYLHNENPSRHANEFRLRLTNLGLTSFGLSQRRLIHPDDPRAQVIRPTRKVRENSPAPARVLPEAVSV